ncbi:MAG TPA: oxidoreductase [Ochrobactrum intermedium]|uniref:Oxidoreductase n=1 Tax=Brucella intermedia TaxID=94625 RepID=A0A7V6PES1_9HYPH|nr:MDR family oxidoreductase [Brucella intermedia]HHV69463.1 oxidoreductase [Brucella intermedia]
MTFKALLISRTDDAITSAVTELDESQLPEGDVLVDVEYSTINYKDGLVLQGAGGLVKTYPHVPGVDFAGIVSESKSPDFKPGDRVVLTGWRVGEIHWGGLAEKARVKGDWLLALPDAVSTRDAMAVGTAGLTAMLAVIELERQGLTPDKGPILVTGATGGVGTFATRILADLGYDVHALSGKPEMADYLRGLGASEVIARSEMAEPNKRPLEGAKWAGCVDAVGGTILARALAQMEYGGVVAAIGLAGGAALNTTVVPFLLRGVKLIGIDSVMCPADQRRAAWKRFAESGVISKVSSGVKEIGLEDAGDAGRQILRGEISGRVVVKIGG